MRVAIKTGLNGELFPGLVFATPSPGLAYLAQQEVVGIEQHEVVFHAPAATQWLHGAMGTECPSSICYQ